MKYLQLTLLTLILIGSSCAPKPKNIPYTRTGMVKCVGHDRQTITVESEAQAGTIGKAIAYAEINAFENILFKGIPNSNQESPLVPNEYKSTSENRGFYTAFLDNGGYASYMMSTTLSDDFESNGVHLVTQKIQIDLHRLRKNLEKIGIIKYLGL